jgi:acyl carrier protein
MNVAEVEKKVRKILAFNLGISENEIDLEKSLKEMGMGIYDGCEITLNLEDAFPSILIADEEFKELTTAKKMVEYVIKHTQN